MRKALFKCAVGAAYWAVVVLFLRSASPVFMDGGGPMPSFGWGKMPSPTLGEYYSRKSYYDSLYWSQYLLAGLAATAVGYAVAPRLRRRFSIFSSRPFVGTAGVTLVLLLLLTLLSDVGVKLGIWTAPQFLLHSNYDLFCILALAKLLLPASLLSGVVEASRSMPKWTGLQR
jgi:hypothetical protein